MLPFDITKLPQKVWLSGSDCFHLVLDKHSQKHKAGGNVMHKLFYFNETPEANSILATLHSSALVYWLCNIEIQYGSLWRIPYWRFTNTGNQPQLHQYHHAVENELPAEVLNRDIPLHADCFIVFSLVQYPSGKSVLVMSWNHILMDGKGTSMFLQHLEDLRQGKPNEFGHFFPAKDKRPNIIGYISNMYKVKAFIQKSSKAPIASVAPKANPAMAGIGFETIRFTAEETKKMDAIAFEKGARFGANLFYLSCCLHTINGVLQQKKKAGTMWIPVPYDGRLRGAVGPIISNCVSYLFYRIPPEQLQSIKKNGRLAYQPNDRPD